MRFALDQASWLALLPLAGVVWWLAQRRPGRSGRQQRLAAATRAVAVALLILALAGPRWVSGSPGVDVALLVDVSDSMSAEARAAVRDWIDRTLEAQGPRDRVALALFGRDARLEHGLRADPPPYDPAVVVDGSATDLARALRLGQGVVGSDRRRRIVLVTDGRATQGDTTAAAEELAEAGVGLDVVRIGATAPADVLVEEVRSPGTVRAGEGYEVTVVLQNTGADPADGTLVVTADGAEVDRRTVRMPPGRTEVRVDRVAGPEPGTVRYEARLSSGASTVAVNDVGRTAVRTEGPPRVLVFERADGLGAPLAGALDSAGVPADRLSADAGPLPPLDGLLDYDSVVLVDVHASTLGDSGLVALDTYVREAGRGLVAVGGEQSYGMGDYEGTLLEDLLPVYAQITDPRRRPSVAQALVVDTSGSMGACHCRDEQFATGGMEGGPVKTDIAREGAARAIAALESQDQVGILAFDTRSRWVLPLQHLPEHDAIDDALAQLRPDGNTDITQAVREAIAGLRDVDARLRHIVLFTDGFMDNLSPLFTAAEEARDAGVTLSVIGTGEGSFDELRRVAAIGGGRYYPGRNLAAIPNIIALEVRFAARPVLNEGLFTPAVTALAPATGRLDATPPLLGYLATTAKPAAQTLLVVGEERDPLLASWRAGLGTAVAWTSDAAPRWSAQWVGWDGFATFWADVVKGTFPARADPGFALAATATADGLRITMDLTGPAPADVVAGVTVTDPRGEREPVRLDRTSLTTFEALLDATEEGVYAVAGGLRHGEELIHHDTATAIRSWSPEYGPVAVAEEALAQAVHLTGGRLDPRPAAVFDQAGLPPGQASRELWPLLAVLALVLAPIDVGLRRLRLERADWGRFKDWLRARRRRPRAAAPERDEATEGLFAAKRRAQGDQQGDE